MKEHNGRAENVAQHAAMRTESTEMLEVDQSSNDIESRKQRQSAISVPARHEYETPQAAAVRLGLDVQALRARCRRAAKRVGNDVVAHLGGGIVAVKLGSSWRIRFPAG
jgi:hypothetical protein